jgi:hypothetical protein
MKTMKHNTAKLFAAAAALTLVAAGCSVQEENTVERREVKFAASVGSFQVKATDTAFEEGDTIGLYADYPVSAYNVRLDWQNGSLVPEAPVYWGADQLIDQSSLFYAYYPYGAGVNGQRYLDFTVREDQSTHEGYTASDLMTAATYATPAEGTVNLNFVHRLSKLVITIDNQLTDEAITEVYVGNVRLSAEVDIAFSQDSGSFGDPGSIKAGEGVNAQQQQAWSVILPSQNAQPKILIVTRSGKQYVYESQYDVYFSAARRHTAHVILDETSIATTFSGTVSDWIDNGDWWFKQDNPGKYLGEWSVIGSIQGTNWDTDFAMQKAEDTDYVWYTTIDYYTGNEFKFRMDGSWDVNFGLEWVGTLGDWWSAKLMEGGYNISLESDGRWYVQLDVYNKEVLTFLVESFEPQETELDQIQPVVDSEDGTYWEFTQVVYALSTRGFVLYDGKYSVFAYTASDPGVSIGDIVKVCGNKITYNGVPEIEKPTFEVLGHTDDLMDLSYMYNDVTSYLDQDFASIAIPISIEGLLGSDAYTLTVEDQEFNGSVYYAVSALGLSNLVGHNVRVSGFYNGRSSSRQLVYIIATKVEDLGVPADPGNVYGTWSLIGTISGTSWDTDFVMESDDENYPGLRGYNLIYHEGEEFKFRKDGSWDTNFGIGYSSPFTAYDGEQYDLVADGGNIALEKSGIWGIYIDVVNATFAAFFVGELPDFTTNVSYTLVSKAYTNNVLNVQSYGQLYENVTNIKLGTASAVGECTFVIPAGSTSISFWAVGWKGDDTTLNFWIDGLVGSDGTPEEIELTAYAQDGASGNSPYNVTVDTRDQKRITIPAHTEDLVATIKTVSPTYRAFIFGIQVH